MNWSRYFMHDFFTAAEFHRIEEKLKRQSQNISSSQRPMLDRISELEDEVARLSLLTHALAETCVASGAITREKLGETIYRVDAEDGVVDGKKTPEQETPEPRTAHEFLSDLERKDRSS